MPKLCPECKYYSPNNEEVDCPKCHVPLRFTLLGPVNDQPPPVQEITPVEPETPRTGRGLNYYKGNEPDWYQLLMKLRTNWLLVSMIGVPFVLLVLFLLGGVVGGDKYDQLKIGMTRREAESIISPRFGASSRMTTYSGGDETVTVGGIVLVFRDGILVEKYRQDGN